MLTNIRTLYQLEEEAKSIQDYLDCEIPDEGAAIVDMGNTINVYMSRTGKMLADAKYHQNKAVKESILHELKESINLPASTLNNLVKSSTERESHLVDWIDRMNRVCTHRVDWLRSVLSKLKAEQSKY